MMDFFSSMFQGIGDTFTAGAEVNKAQIGEREQKRQLEVDKKAILAGVLQTKYDYLIQDAQAERKLITIVVVALIAVLALLVIFRRRK